MLGESDDAQLAAARIADGRGHRQLSELPGLLAMLQQPDTGHTQLAWQLLSAIVGTVCAEGKAAVAAVLGPAGLCAAVALVQHHSSCRIVVAQGLLMLRYLAHGDSFTAETRAAIICLAQQHADHDPDARAILENLGAPLNPMSRTCLVALGSTSPADYVHSIEELGLIGYKLADVCGQQTNTCTPGVLGIALIFDGQQLTHGAMVHDASELGSTGTFSHSNMEVLLDVAVRPEEQEGVVQSIQGYLGRGGVLVGHDILHALQALRIPHAHLMDTSLMFPNTTVDTGGKLSHQSTADCSAGARWCCATVGHTVQREATETTTTISHRRSPRIARPSSLESKFGLWSSYYQGSL